MSITYKEILRRVRFKLKDNDEATTSDYEIRDCLNEVLRYVSMSNALSNADFNEKTIRYNEDDFYGVCCDNHYDHHHDHKHHHFCFALDGVPLPEDFLSLVAVKPHANAPMLEPCLSSETPRPWQYKISGDKIYCGPHHFVLVYKAGVTEVVDDESEIELPRTFLDFLVNMTIMNIQQAESGVLREAIDSALQSLIPQRRYRNAKIRMPFKIGGWF